MTNPTTAAVEPNPPASTSDTPAQPPPRESLEMGSMPAGANPEAAADKDAQPRKETGPDALEPEKTATGQNSDSRESSAASATTDAAAAAAAAAAKGKEKDTDDVPKREKSLTVDPTSDAINPASSDSAVDSSSAAAATAAAATPACNITLLLPTGARHPYRIDEKYLSKRNVEIPDLTEDGKRDPFSISIYKLKELILREWRDEWEARPASPSSIRLIHFGKLLDDKEQLKKYQFSAESPNVIHMSVKPAEMLEEEEGAKGKSSGPGSRSRDGGGCCVIL